MSGAEQTPRASDLFGLKHHPLKLCLQKLPQLGQLATSNYKKPFTACILGVAEPSKRTLTFATQAQDT